jgi:hypothetical protein
VLTGLTDDTRYPIQTFVLRKLMMLTRANGKWLIQAGQNAKLEKGPNKRTGSFCCKNHGDRIGVKSVEVNYSYFFNLKQENSHKNCFLL